MVRHLPLITLSATDKWYRFDETPPKTASIHRAWLPIKPLYMGSQGKNFLPGNRIWSRRSTPPVSPPFQPLTAAVSWRSVKLDSRPPSKTHPLGRPTSSSPPPRSPAGSPSRHHHLVHIPGVWCGRSRCDFSFPNSHDAHSLLYPVPLCLLQWREMAAA
jgi:hypothetical protein